MMGDAAVEILLFAALAGLTFIPLERLYGKRGEARHGLLTDLGFATLGAALVKLGIVLGVGSLLAVVDGIAIETPVFEGIASRPLRVGLEVVVGLLLFECVGYGYHRLAHRVPWLWRLHAVHHSSERMDWLASFRQHPLEIIAVTLAQNVPLVLLDLPLGSHALVLLLLRLNTVFVHSNLQIPRGWWSALIATPHFHHRHHQRRGAARNFAAMFPWLDRLFGTFDDTAADDVGLPVATPQSLWGLLLLPFDPRLPVDAHAS